MPKSKAITKEEIKLLLSLYALDSHGHIVYAKAGRNKRIGDRAGCARGKGLASSRVITVRYKGKCKQYPETKVMWLLKTKKWPTRTVYLRSGTDVTASNLTLNDPHPTAVAAAKASKLGYTPDILRKIIRYNKKTGQLTRIKKGSLEWQPVKPYEAKGYHRVRVLYRTFSVHQLAFLLVLGYIPPIIDHRNGNKKDNRWSNLREASASDNVCNKPTRTNNKLGHKNICFSKGTFQVGVCKDGVRRFKRFHTLEEALRYRNELLNNRHGDFANYGKYKEQEQEQEQEQD